MNKSLEKPDLNTCTEKQWKKWFWGDYNEMCKECKKSCKQSHVVKLTCIEFEKMLDKLYVYDKLYT